MLAKTNRFGKQIAVKNRRARPNSPKQPVQMMVGGRRVMFQTSKTEFGTPMLDLCTSRIELWGVGGDQSQNPCDENDRLSGEEQSIRGVYKITKQESLDSCFVILVKRKS